MASFAGDTPCWIPDEPIGREEEPRINIAKFGDGYEQRVLDGINSLNQNWRCNWENREKSIVVSMINFLAAQKGNAFQFKEPATGVMYQVFCDKWTVSWNIRRKGSSPATPLWYGTVTAEFRKANGVTI